MFAILGSGFGLYGYLPALIDGCGETVLLPRRYESRLRGRPELADYLGAVRWARDEEDSLDVASGAVLALPPRVQSEWVERCLSRANIERLVLEKPLAVTPAQAESLLKALRASNRMFRIAYTFRHTPWGATLRGALAQRTENAQLALRWSFEAHHFRHHATTWKRRHSEGGGVIRFYGIHVIALLAELGYREVLSSRVFGKLRDEPDEWHAAFGGAGLPSCDVEIRTRSKHPEFTGKMSDKAGDAASLSWGLLSPFGPDPANENRRGLDERIVTLQHLCRSLWAEDRHLYDSYAEANRLWALVERVTGFPEDLGSPEE